ncbi:DUF4435 domain-containing protein [Desulfococcaceae bacterium HSG8]|nr:DUF4435 domain-containing protein [Desulfococcaceae bacterium HSG8]
MDYISASNYFRPDIPKDQITVFVESEPDVPFWSRIFRKCGFINFKINPSVRGDSSRGKTVLIDIIKGDKNFLHFGKSLRPSKLHLICMDSDYDYLLQEASDNFRLINQEGIKDYVFQTYTYSIENYKCYAESLSDLCVEASHNNEFVFDFVQFMKEYSEIIYDLFLYSFSFCKNGDSSFSIKDFGKCISLVDIIYDYTINIDILKQRVEEKIKSFLIQIDMDELSENLQQLGLGKDNTYLFVNGHHIFDYVVFPILNRIAVKKLREKNRSEIEKCESATNENKKRFSNLIKESDLKTLLNHNTDYDSCFLMKKIKEDIERYKNKYWS